MFSTRDLLQPETFEQAYETLISRRSNTVLGGCAFLRLGRKKMGTAIDLSKLGLNFIREADHRVEIGAMTTLRDIETSPLLASSFSGLLPRAVRNIVGVQFRNGATVGGSVFSRSGFSDLLTALLVLDCEVTLFHGGTMPLAEFACGAYEKDILTKISLGLDARAAAYQSFRNTTSDFSVLNVAVSCLGGRWLVAVGARPQRARVAVNASEFLSQEGGAETNASAAALLAGAELSFGTNMRATAEFRRALCQVLVKRAVTEVKQCS
ncbi:putative oxidoreductase [Peptococcaceae bacterium CEB3]|nr:putative oxidoreductase [Peptococcaceae bacterium CEB3]